MDTTNVIPMPIAWTQSRNTKLGHATIEIVQVQDLFEATVSFTNENCETFSASETFGDVRSAFHWAYGLKQSTNDDYAGYTRDGVNLIENKPKKGYRAKVIPIINAIADIRHSYDNFALGRTCANREDTISVSQVKSSALSEQDQATLLALMSKAKGQVANG